MGTSPTYIATKLAALETSNILKNGDVRQTIRRNANSAVDRYGFGGS